MTTPRFEVADAGKTVGAVAGLQTPPELYLKPLAGTDSGKRAVQTGSGPSDKGDAGLPKADSKEKGGEKEKENFKAKDEKPDPEEIKRGIKALKDDAMKGDGWSKESTAMFQKVFESEKALNGASAESIADALNMVGAAINRAVKPDLAKIPGRRDEPIGMAVMRNQDGSFSFYMMLNKDNAALKQNRADLIAGKPNPAVIKVGTFKPEN